MRDRRRKKRELDLSGALRYASRRADYSFRCGSPVCFDQSEDMAVLFETPRVYQRSRENWVLVQWSNRSNVKSMNNTKGIRFMNMQRLQLTEENVKLFRSVRFRDVSFFQVNEEIHGWDYDDREDWDDEVADADMSKIDEDRKCCCLRLWLRYSKPC